MKKTAFKHISYVLIMCFLFSVCLLTAGCNQSNSTVNYALTVEMLELPEKTSSDNIRTESELRSECPQYFDIQAMKGIEVYTWKESGISLYGMLPGTNRHKTAEELERLQEHGVTLGELNTILLTYGIDISKDEVHAFNLDVVSIK